MKRINILWALPLILPFVLVAMSRLLWAMTGLPWEPHPDVAGIVVACGMLTSVISVVIVGYMQSEGSGIWWTFKKEKSDDQPSGRLL